jgi:hypothetical protein
MEPDMRSRVVSLEHKLLAVEPRLSIVETWQRQADIFHARRDEQFTNMLGRFKGLEDKLDKLTGGISRLIWTVGAAFLLAIATFIIKGGLNVP